MNKQITEPGNWASKTTKNTIHLFYWTATWLLTTALARFGTEYFWPSSKLLTGLSILLNVIIGFGMILAVKKYLKGLDEMQQKIQLDAMAVSLAVGLVIGLAYTSMDQTNLIPFNARISDMIMLMSVTYIVGIFVGLRKYR